MMNFNHWKVTVSFPPKCDGPTKTKRNRTKEREEKQKTLFTLWNQLRESQKLINHLLHLLFFLLVLRSFVCANSFLDGPFVDLLHSRCVVKPKMTDKTTKDRNSHQKLFHRMDFDQSLDFFQSNSM